MKTVPDIGPLDARIAIIGESPGANEMVQGEPFVGASGRRLNAWLHGVGLRREDIRIMNVVPYKVVIARLSREEGEHWAADLRRRLELLTQPVVLVPQGNLALWATTGKGRVPWHMRDGRNKRPGITDWRGSILHTELNGRVVKVIPTIHPAATFQRKDTPAKKAQQYLRACLADWKRIAQDSTFRELRTSHSEHHINPSRGECLLFLEEVQRKAEVLSVDIETPFQRIPMVLTAEGWLPRTASQGRELVLYKSGKKKGQVRTKEGWGPASIACVGFAYTPESSLTIPMRDDTKDIIAQLLALPTPKVMQNGFFDCYWLRDSGFPVSNFWYDTRALHHLLDPTAPHSLQYLVSVYTRRPFFKAEAKSPEEVMKYATNFDALQSYCGMDVCGTLEVFWELHRRLSKRGLLPIYNAHYRDLIEPLLDISLHGIRVDESARGPVLAELQEKVANVERRLEEAVGYPLVAKTGISTQRLKKFIYEECKLPVQRRRDPSSKKMRITTDEVAIRKLMEMPQGKACPKFAKAAPLILMHRETKKKAELLAPGLVDPDGRMRCGIGFITDTTRLTSQDTPKGQGRNLMNLDRKMRKMWVPDED